MSIDEAVSGYLARNLKQLRESRGLTQSQIAQHAGVPRATWAHLESGLANPTLSVLIRVAEALQVRLEELLEPPRSNAKLYRAQTLPVRVRGNAQIRRLLPESLAGLDIERMELPPKTMFTGVPHTPGTREYLTCEIGDIELSLAGEVHRLTPGDVLVFRGDQKHGYKNPGRKKSVAYSVVTFAPIER